MYHMPRNGITTFSRKCGATQLLSTKFQLMGLLMKTGMKLLMVPGRFIRRRRLVALASSSISLTDAKMPKVDERELLVEASETVDNDEEINWDDCELF